MTVLPILARELRIQARSRANYWGRVGIAGAALLACVPTLLLAPPFGASRAMGRPAFDGLTIAAFLLCCAACLLTADTISGERREGTLGLLFLTRVSHFDVLLGKLGSRCLPCALGLLTFMPVLALPILAGGVTGGEAARTALALFNLLFLALSVGFWASSRGVERFRTARAALIVILALVLVPTMLGWFPITTGSRPALNPALASPLATVTAANDMAYRAASRAYWVSLGLVHAIGWAFLFGAVVTLRRRMGDIDEQLPPRKTRVQPARAAVPPVIPRLMLCRYCGRSNVTEASYCSECGTALHPAPAPTSAGLASFRLSTAPTPLHWLLHRQRGLKLLFWAAAGIGFFQYALFLPMQFFGFRTARGLPTVTYSSSLIVSAATGALFAWAAGRFFVEARRTGELELLLTTPMGARHIAAAQWNVLKRWLAWPVGVMLLPLLLQGFFMFSFPFPFFRDPWRLSYGASMLLSAVNVVLSVAACCWLAMWFSARGMTQGRAVLWTVLIAKGLPYALSLAWTISYRFMLATMAGAGSPWSSLPVLLVSLLPQLGTIVFLLLLMAVARRHLAEELAGAEPLNFRQILHRAMSRARDLIRRSRDWPPGGV